MTDLRLLEDYKTLFSGNEEAYGTEIGGCIRKPPPWEEHLYGQTPIGIYPTYGEGYEHEGLRVCNWGCIDLDVKTDKKPSGDYESPDDAHMAARNLLAVLNVLGLKGWIEQTRSNGRHVWVFKRTNMRTMRAALLVACQLAKVKPTEVNPKSFELAPDELGNYVRLPYPSGGTTAGRFPTTRRIMSTSVSFMQVGNFVSAALEGVDDLGPLEAAAKLYKAPSVTVSRTIDMRATRDPENAEYGLTKALRGLPRVIWAEGRLDGSDRSGTLFKMAVALVKQGYPVEDIAEILAVTDEKWFGKYSGRKDPRK